MKWRQFERCIGHEDVALPRRATQGSAGYDLASAADILIPRKSMALVPTGLKAFMQQPDVLMIYLRSGQANRGLRLANSVGIIDSDYYNNPQNEGHILLMVENVSGRDVQIVKGERIAQGIFTQYEAVDDDVALSMQRLGGFGSTDDQKTLDEKDGAVPAVDGDVPGHS